MLGTEKLNSLIASAVETVEGETTDDAMVGVAMLIIEIRDRNGVTAFYTFCTDKREWVQRAVVDEAKMAIDFSEVGEEVDDG